MGQLSTNGQNEYTLIPATPIDEITSNAKNFEVDGKTYLLVNQDAEIAIYHNTNQRWSVLETVQLPFDSVSSYYIFNGKHYFAMLNNSVYEYDSQTLKKLITNFVISQINGFGVNNSQLALIGIFTDPVNGVNIMAVLNNSEFELKKQEVFLLNGSIDELNYCSIYDRLFFSGNFVDKRTGFEKNVISYGQSFWSFDDFPPAFSQINTIHSLGEELWASGAPLVNEAYVQSKNIVWSDISSGLKDYQKVVFYDFVKKDDIIYASGQFIDSEGKSHQLMIYENKTWSPLNIQFNSNAKIDLSLIGNELLLSSDISLNNFGFKHFYLAQGMYLTARFFNDINENCIFDSTDYSTITSVLMDNQVFFTSENGFLKVPLTSGNHDLGLNNILESCSNNSLSFSVNKFESVHLGTFALQYAISEPHLSISLNDFSGWQLDSTGDWLQFSIQNFGLNPNDSFDISIVLPSYLKLIETNMGTIDEQKIIISNKSIKPGEQVRLKVKVEFVNGVKEVFFQDFNFSAVNQVNDPILFEKYGNYSSSIGDIAGQRVSKTLAQGRAIHPTNDVLNYKISLNNQNNDQIKSMTIVDKLDDDIVLRFGELHIESSHEYNFESKVNLADNGNYIYTFYFSFPELDINGDSAGFDSKAFLNLSIPYDNRELKKGAEICNQAKFLLNDDDVEILTNEFCAIVTDKNSISNGITAVHKNTFKVYPNPSEGVVYIENMQGKQREFIVISSKGQWLDSFTVMPNGIHKIDSQYGSGLYIIKDINSQGFARFSIH